MTIAPNLARFAEAQSAWLLGQVHARICSSANPPSEEEIHQIRVAIRRWQQACKIANPETRNHGLDELMELAGAVRDYDVALALVGELEQNGNALHQLRQGREFRARELSAALAQWKSKTVAASAAVEPDFDAASEASALLAQLAKNFLKRGDKAAAEGGAKRLHKFRMAAKQFRYTLSLLERVLALRNWIDGVRGVQDRLGAVNDCKSVRGLLRREEVGSTRLEDLLKAKQRHAVKMFRAHWQEEFGKPAQARRWVKGLAELSGA